MTRARHDYTAPAVPVDPRSEAVGFDPDLPIAGYYRRRMISGGVWVGVRIWFGAPLDPVTGDELDRSHRWQAQVNGEMTDVDRVWPHCAADTITEREYAYLTKLQRWAEDNAPDTAFADPRKKIDLLASQTPLPF